MAAVFTPISEADLDQFFTRSFHALHPKKVVERNGEFVYELFFSPKIGVKVYTSAFASGFTGRKGEDLIRVYPFNFGRGRPLMSEPEAKKLGLWCKRTQGWRDTLRSKVEELLEKYDVLENVLERGGFVDWSKVEWDKAPLPKEEPSV